MQMSTSGSLGDSRAGRPSVPRQPKVINGGQSLGFIELGIALNDNHPEMKVFVVIYLLV